jgi:hypothetical protein
MKTGHKPPAGLSNAAVAWWKALASDYDISDSAGLLSLETAAFALDRMLAAKKLIDKEGITVLDRFGQPRAHPAIVVERDSRAAMLTTLRALRLDVEPLNDSIGRPHGS